MDDKTVANIVSIIEELLPIVLKYGTEVVEKVINMIKEDPNLPPDQLKAKITEHLQDAIDKDNTIINE